MPTHIIPHSLAVWATAISHGVMVAGAVALYLGGKIDSTAFAAVMAGFGAGWSGVAGALITVRKSQAVTLSTGVNGAPNASAAPVSHTSATLAPPA